MITFHKIKWSNLLSSGNQPIEISLDNSPSTLISGKNGSGKSMILDAICIALYGKPFRKVKKGQLVNSVNGSGLEVEVYFSIGENSFRVKRGIKPNIFEIYRNDDLIPQDSTTKDYQILLEDQILKVSYTSFVQIVILGSSSYIPFMRLPTHSRRHIVENILDISVFSIMSKLLKDRTSDLGKLKLAAEKDFEKFKDIYKVKKELADQSKIDIDNRAKELRERILSNNEKSVEYTTRIGNLTGICDPQQEYRKEKESLIKQRDQLAKYKIKIGQNLNITKKKIKFYNDHVVCPDCNQDLTEDHKRVHVTAYEAKQKSFKEAIKDLDSKLAGLDSEISILSDKIAEIEKTKMEIHKLQTMVASIQDTVSHLYKEIENLETTPASISVEDLEELRENVKKLAKEIDGHSDTLRIFSIVQSLLKDDGIKTKIIRYYLPVVNSTVNKYLEKMNFIVNFTFDENFNEKILSRNRDDFSYFSFSEGEKSRIDLALLFTWREVAKRKNSTATNLLFLDEVFDSSLDAEGTDAFMGVISAGDEYSNIFVISHSPDVLQSKFDRTIDVRKEGNFTQYFVSESENF